MINVTAFLSTSIVIADELHRLSLKFIFGHQAELNEAKSSGGQK